MAAKIVFLEKLLVVVRHPYEVELSKTERGVDPCWVHVTVANALLVDVY